MKGCFSIFKSISVCFGVGGHSSWPSKPIFDFSCIYTGMEKNEEVGKHLPDKYGGKGSWKVGMLGSAMNHFQPTNLSFFNWISYKQ